MRWALTPPFHPYPSQDRRFLFCDTFHRVTPPRCYLVLRPLKARTFLQPFGQRLPDHLTFLLYLKNKKMSNRPLKGEITVPDAAEKEGAEWGEQLFFL